MVPPDLESTPSSGSRTERFVFLRPGTTSRAFMGWRFYSLMCRKRTGACTRINVEISFNQTPVAWQQCRQVPSATEHRDEGVCPFELVWMLLWDGMSSWTHGGGSRYGDAGDRRRDAIAVTAALSIMPSKEMSLIITLLWLSSSVTLTVSVYFCYP